MPSNSKKSKQAVKNIVNFDFEEKEHEVAEEAPPVGSNRARKRNFSKPPSDEETDSEQAQDTKVDTCEMEMQNVLSSFGADITRTLAAKRKRLQLFTQASLKSANRKYEDTLSSQQMERKKLCEEFSRQIDSVFTQWDSDLSKSKESEEKMENMLRQQFKSMQQNRIVQTQRIRAIKQLHEQFNKTLVDLEKVHQDQQSTIQGEIRKELSQLQKKMLMDTQQEEISNVRKSLQTMLAQV
ncbi:synaptonemal complex protein 3-like [Rhopilema esculentum]|uniref:synaptonemal complex protein 3-like n=1 Tax=Rhopilema esculentum TaxID=499914 RepID=UPI0031DA7DF4